MTIDYISQRLFELGEKSFSSSLRTIAYYQPQMNPKYYSSSYLCWPVRMNNSPLYHITLKYFGDKFVVSEEVKNIIENCDTSGPSDFTWVPRDWSREDEDIFVLELTNCPQTIYNLNKKFDYVREDDYDFTPHISVEKDLWNQIVDESLEANDLKLTIGPLSLMSGKIILDTF